jgi:hypothetical protein
MELHQVLLRTLHLQLPVTDEVFKLMLRTNHLHHQQLHMGWDKSMSVLLAHLLLVVSTIKNFLSRKERETIIQEFINQCQC